MVLMASSSAEEAANMKPGSGTTETAQVQVTAAFIENEFPHWKVWAGSDQLLHACVPWDTNMYVMAETLAGLRDGIIGCLRLRELALDQLKETGAVSPQVFLGEHAQRSWLNSNPAQLESRGAHRSGHFMSASAGGHTGRHGRCRRRR